MSATDSRAAWDRGRYTSPTFMNSLASQTTILSRLTTTLSSFGISIKVAGADDFDEFPQLLRKGTSQYEKVTPERLNFDSPFRKPNARDYFCNFVRDIDAFDNKFFKRSPRESAAMDP